MDPLAAFRKMPGYTPTTYKPVGSTEMYTLDGEPVEVQWWQVNTNLSPLPDAHLPSFPRRVDYEGRDDGGWLQIDGVGGIILQPSAYGPCGCCFGSPCIPQCPVQAVPPRVPTFWRDRWGRVADARIARGADVNPLYKTDQSPPSSP
jgi:hypothetical protein